MPSLGFIVLLVAAFLALSAAVPDTNKGCSSNYPRWLLADINSFPTAPLFEGMYLWMEYNDTTRITKYMHESRDLGAWVHHDGSWVIKNYWIGDKVWLEKFEGVLEYYDPLEDNGKYVELHSEDVKFECDATPTIHQCSTNTFRFGNQHNHVLSSVAGETFTLVHGKCNNGLPEYRSQKGLILSYKQNRWQVADGQDSVLLVAHSNASNPAYINAEWKKSVQPNKWSNSHGLHLICQTSREVENHSSCLSHSTYHPTQGGQYCLCTPDFTGPTCSEKLAACPNHRDIPGAVGRYPTQTNSSYPGDIVTFKCGSSMTKPFVRISCHQDEQGVSRWSDDVTCENAPQAQSITESIDQNPQQISSDKADNENLNGILIAVCIVLAVAIVVLLVVLVSVVIRKHRVRYNKNLDPETRDSREPLSQQQSTDSEQVSTL